MHAEPAHAQLPDAQSPDAQSPDAERRLSGTVFTAAQARLLKWTVIVMGILLVGGFALLVSVIVYQASGPGAMAPSAPTADGATAAASLDLAPGAAITHVALDGERMALHVVGPRGTEIVILDWRTGRVLNRLRLRQE